MATSLPSTAPKLLRLASSWATEISFQSRYPAGILVTTIEDASAANGADAESTNTIAPPAIAMPIKYGPKRFMAASWSSDEFDCATPLDWLRRVSRPTLIGLMSDHPGVG